MSGELEMGLADLRAVLRAADWLDANGFTNAATALTRKARESEQRSVGEDWQVCGSDDSGFYVGSPRPGNAARMDDVMALGRPDALANARAAAAAPDMIRILHDLTSHAQMGLPFDYPPGALERMDDALWKVATGSSAMTDARRREAADRKAGR